MSQRHSVFAAARNGLRHRDGWRDAWRGGCCYARSLGEWLIEAVTRFGREMPNKKGGALEVRA